MNSTAAVISQQDTNYDSSPSLVPLTKEQAIKISQVTSSLYVQGSSWVFEEMELTTGRKRLTRGLTQAAARTRLKSWRKEKVEELMRNQGPQTAFLIQRWHENPSWQGEGIWEPAQRRWYACIESAEAALSRLEAENDSDHQYKITELPVSELPSQYTVA